MDKSKTYHCQFKLSMTVVSAHLSMVHENAANFSLASTVACVWKKKREKRFDRLGGTYLNREWVSGGRTSKSRETSLHSVVAWRFGTSI